MKVRGEISCHFFKTAKHSIRALAWCAKHIWAWRGSDHIRENEPAVTRRHRGKMRVMMREEVAPGNDSSPYRRYLTCSPCFPMNTKKCFCFCSMCSTMSCYSRLIRQPMHREIAAYVLTEIARQGRILRFAFLCILKCATFTGVTGHAASLSGGVRQSSHTEHREAQQNAKERNNTVRTPPRCWRRLKMSCFWYLMLLWKREGWALSFMQVKLQTEWGALTTGGVFREHYGSGTVLCSIRNGPQAAHLHCQWL